MMKSLMFGVSAFLLVGCMTGLETAPIEEVALAETAKSSQAKYLGVYAGTYVCSLGENAITVSIDRLEDIEAAKIDVSRVEARLWFYDTVGNPGHPSGAFNLEGLVNSRSVEMTPGEWISAVPSNWGAAGIKGDFRRVDGDLYLHGKPSGPGTSACEAFTLKRLESF